MLPEDLSDLLAQLDVMLANSGLAEKKRQYAKGDRSRTRIVWLLSDRALLISMFVNAVRRSQGEQDAADFEQQAKQKADGLLMPWMKSQLTADGLETLLSEMRAQLRQQSL